MCQALENCFSHWVMVPTSKALRDMVGLGAYSLWVSYTAVQQWSERNSTKHSGHTYSPKIPRKLRAWNQWAAQSHLNCSPFLHLLKPKLLCQPVRFRPELKRCSSSHTFLFAMWQRWGLKQMRIEFKYMCAYRHEKLEASAPHLIWLELSSSNFA